MAIIQITSRGKYMVLVNDELLAICEDLSAAMKAASGYRVIFGWQGL